MLFFVGFGCKDRRENPTKNNKTVNVFLVPRKNTKQATKSSTPAEARERGTRDPQLTIPHVARRLQTSDVRQHQHNLGGRALPELTLSPNLYPASWMSLPPSAASFSPFGDNWMLYQPVNRFSKFHWDSPCLHRHTHEQPIPITRGHVSLQIAGLVWCLCVCA